VEQSTVTPAERDRRYRELLKSLEGVLAVWKQQPGNTLAMTRYVEELKQKVAAVRASVDRAKPPGAPGCETPSVASKSAAAREPAGPVRSSSAPATPAEKEARYKATMRRMPPGPQAAAASLAGHPEHRIREICNEAHAQLDKLAEQFRKAPNDRREVAKGLTRLNDILEQFKEPVEIPEPTTPRPKPGRTPQL
jgi:hypothetical protein